MGTVVHPDLDLAEQQKKSKNKVRSAWISFVGRIVAQFVGSAATIVLGLMFLQKYHAISEGAVERATPTPPAVETPVTAVRERRETSRPSIAVLPLENFSGDSARDHVAHAMTEALITALSQVGELQVISRTSSMHYRGPTTLLPQVARELAVDWIVEGSVVVVDGRVRVIGQLIDAVTDEHRWAASYDRPFRDVLMLQADLASVVARDVSRAVFRDRRQAVTLTSAADRRLPDVGGASPAPAETLSCQTSGINTYP